MNHHEILPNLRRAIHVKHWWQTQCGDTRSQPPEKGVVYYNGQVASPCDYIFGTTTTVEEEVIRRGAQDTWTEHVEISMSNGHRLTYRGERARKIWNAWKGIVYQK